MRRYQNILFVTRGTADENDALTQALSVARNSSAALQVVIIGPPLPKGFDEYEAGYETSLIEHLQASIASARASLGLGPQQLQVAVEVDCGETPEIRVVRRVLRNAHDLLIKQAEPVERHSGFRALDMQLLRLCPCPVWLCRPTSRPTADTRVAVAIDAQSSAPEGRDLALQLLQLSRSLADAYSGELHVISCWDFEFEEYLRHSPWLRVEEDAIISSVRSAERTHRAELEKLIQDSGIAGRIRVHTTRGRPEQAVPQLVDSLATDILVMGTVARTGIPGFVIGNTAENVLREVRCSLLALKPNGFVSPIRAY